MSLIKTCWTRAALVAIPLPHLTSVALYSRNEKVGLSDREFTRRTIPKRLRRLTRDAFKSRAGAIGNRN